MGVKMQAIQKMYVRVRQTSSFVLVLLILMIPPVFATEDDDECKFGPGNCGFGSCYARGVEDGKKGDYDNSLVDGDCSELEFEPRYNEGFQDGS